MGNKGMEATIQYINRDKVLSLIEEYAEKREDHSKCNPAWTASQIATILSKLPVKESGFLNYGLIQPDFTGINLSLGVCHTCGKKLIWYTKDPIKGCPYCFTRRRKEVTRDGQKQNIHRREEIAGDTNLNEEWVPDSRETDTRCDQGGEK